MQKEVPSGLELEILKEAEKTAKAMAKQAEERRKAREGRDDETAPTRPQRSPELEAVISEISQNLRANVEALVSVEAQFEDGMTRNQLGNMMGFKSKHIYTTLSGRNELGTAVIARFSLALGIPPYLLVMPPAMFKKTYLEGYKTRRAAGHGVTRTAKRV